MQWLAHDYVLEAVSVKVSTKKKHSQERRQTNTTKPVLTSNDCVTAIKVLHTHYKLQSKTNEGN